jgi:hypothetical protein
VFPGEACLCGSGKRYGDCCQPKHLWHPICPNPGGEDSGYSLLKPQRVTFRNVDGDAIRERLMAERRLRCTDTSRASTFWIFFGEPPVVDQYGILCFGDFELKHNRTLVVTGVSDLRMQTLLALLQEIVANVLGEPRITYDTLPVIDKRTGKSRVLRPSQSQPSRRRSKRKRRRR